MAYLFDTNLWIQLLKKRAPAARERIDQLSPSAIVTCSIVKAELLHGSWKYDHPAQRQVQITGATSPYASLAFDDEAAWHYSKLRHLLECQGNIIGPNDLKIAAICLAHDLTLVTGNVDEFSRVPGLKLENWA